MSSVHMHNLVELNQKQHQVTQEGIHVNGYTMWILVCASIHVALELWMLTLVPPPPSYASHITTSAIRALPAAYV